MNLQQRLEAPYLCASPCERARQGQLFGLQTLVCVPSANGVVELGSTELIYQNSDLMNKVRVLFNFNNDLGSVTRDFGSLWLNDPEARDSVNTVAAATASVSVPSHNNNILG